METSGQCACFVRAATASGLKGKVYIRYGPFRNIAQ